MNVVRWASPQLLLAGFLFLLSLGYAVTGGALRSMPAPPALVVDMGPAQLRTVEVRYVVVDVLGLERPGYADVGLPQRLADDPSARLSAALAALRTDLVEIGVWPAAVGAPVGFFVELDRRRLAVVDVAAIPPGGAVDVAVEWAAVRSLVATARLAVAADEVRITVGGEERPTLWGRVALAVP
jgi:hypothetical protein